MSIAKFIAGQEAGDAELMAMFHDIIISKDENVSATIGTMMGKEMIIYNQHNTFKYGLAKAKNYFSLHVLPMYCNPEVYEKYKKLLPKAKFQKGCINFNNQDEMPPAIVSKLISDCSKIDIHALLNKMKESKKAKAK